MFRPVFRISQRLSHTDRHLVSKNRHLFFEKASLFVEFRVNLKAALSYVFIFSSERSVAVKEWPQGCVEVAGGSGSNEAKLFERGGAG